MTDAEVLPKVRRISASQLELFGRCERRWAFSYRKGLKEPFATAAQAGTLVHSVVEHNGPFDKEWEGYPVGQMAALLKSQMPAGVTSHEQRYEVELEGVPLVGVVDAQTEDTVIDLKTTSKIRNAKSIAKLTDDPQRLMYTQFVPTAKRTLWLYGAWDTMLVTSRQVDIDRIQDKERFKLRVIQPAERMLAVPDDVDPLSMKPNVNDCALFPAKGGGGGCPHKNTCFPPGKLKPVVSNSKESNEAMQSLVERLRAKSAANGNEPVAASEPVAPAVQQPATVQQPACGALNNPGGVIDYPEPAPEAPAEAKKRGRKPKATETASASEPEPVSTTKLAPALLTVDRGADAKIIDTLYIDCLPLTEPFENAFTYIGPAAETVANDAQLPNALLIDFSKGGPAIAAQLRADLSGKHIKSLYLETRSVEGKAVMNVLVSIAARVVKGVF